MSLENALIYHLGKKGFLLNSPKLTLDQIYRSSCHFLLLQQICLLSQLANCVNGNWVKSRLVFLVGGRRRGKRGQKSTHDVDIIIEKQYGTIVGEGNKTTAVWRIEGGRAIWEGGGSECDSTNTFDVNWFGVSDSKVATYLAWNISLVPMWMTHILEFCWYHQTFGRSMCVFWSRVELM